MSLTDSNTGPTPHTTISCAECGDEITPGKKRKATTDGAVHHYCHLLQQARSKYRFFIGNPADKKPVSFTLYYQPEEHREFPFITNTNGLNTVNSMASTIGDHRSIAPTDSFFDAVAYTYHWLQCYRPPTHEKLVNEILDEIGNYYENRKIPDHEEWALVIILTNLIFKDPVPPEFEPFVKLCDAVTEFGVPDIETPQH